MKVEKQCRCEGVKKEVKFLQIFGDSRLVCDDCFRKFKL